MNIFILSQEPEDAARMLGDKHVVKMTLETAQLLCSAFPQGDAPYRQTHVNHPCAVWARESRENYEWLIRYGLSVSDEYTYRYGKIHASRRVIHWACRNAHLIEFPRTGLTEFAQAMPEQYRQADSVDAYRAYYCGEKQGILTYTRRNPPEWSILVAG